MLESLTSLPDAAGSQPFSSVAVVSSASLVLGVEASEDASCRGDVSKEFEKTLLDAGASQAYRCGRINCPQPPMEC